MYCLCVIVYLLLCCIMCVVLFICDCVDGVVCVFGYLKCV